MTGGLSEGQAHEPGVWTDVLNSLDDGVVFPGVILRRGAVLGIGLVEDFPNRNLEVVTGFVPNAVLIGEATVDIPAGEALIVGSELGAGGIAELCALFVVPLLLRRIDGICDGRFRDIHPLWMVVKLVTV